MKSLSSDEIRNLYNDAAAPQDTLYTRALAALSRAIDALNKEGIDCEMNIFGCATEHGFALNPGAGVSTWSQQTGGMLRIGNSEHLLSFVTQVKLKSEGEDAEWHPCMILCVSKLDIRHQGPRSDVRTNVYQIVEGSDDLRAFQAFIIDKAAADAVIAANDPQGVFTRHGKTPARSTLIKKNQPGA